MKTFKAFSLVEMLITLGIMAIVIMIATQTLTTLLRVSTITRYKTMTRNEMDFSMELTERLLANSNVSDVYIFNSFDSRYYDIENNTVENVGAANIPAVYDSQLLPGVLGNEIHFRPYGYSLWVCIGFFETQRDLDNNPVDREAVILRRTMSSLAAGHQHCFVDEGEPNPAHPILVLNSDDVNVKDFNISYTRSLSYNNVFFIDMEMEPKVWLPSERSTIERSVYRQSIITTKGLTWY